MLEKCLVIWLYGSYPWVPFAILLGILSGVDIVWQILKSGDPAWVFGPDAKPRHKVLFSIIVFIVGYAFWPISLAGYIGPLIWKFLTRPCYPH